MRALLLLVGAAALSQAHDCSLSGVVRDPQGNPVPGAKVRIAALGELVRSDTQGRYCLEHLPEGPFVVSTQAQGFETVTQTLPQGHADLFFVKLAAQKDSIVITASVNEPGIDLRNEEVFNRTLFSRDDQVLQQLNAGINAGQHEGGGKSLEIRRFGFNTDHGGVNGGLKILVDGVQQNQGTQGHGQGYLGSLKALSPELIQDATIVNGPFSAEYGDFSGLGVVHIHQRESLPDQFTARLQGGNYDTARGFLAFSPDAQRIDSYVAYEGSYTNGPFENPGRYRRDNVNANVTRALSSREKIGFRGLFGRNNFYSSGQLPLDLVDSGELDRFGYIDPSLGGRVKLATGTTYYSREFGNGGVLKADGFVSRSLFDLYSNFTFYLNGGDGFQQHDSRLQGGANAQYSRPHKIGSALTAIATAGGNYLDNSINVGLYPQVDRVPLGVTSRAQARVTSGSGYAQDNLSFWNGRVLVTGGLRFDEFRYRIGNDALLAGRWQGKGALAVTPSRRVPVSFHVNYGRGISSADARGVLQRPDQPRLATTDFYQAGFATHFQRRLSLAGDFFLIDNSNAMVYIPDDGSFELQGPSRAYGFEGKASWQITRRLSLNGGLTKVANAFYRGGPGREPVTNAPRFVANAALTLSAWRGWSGSLRMREINHYAIDPAVLAAGHTIWDLGISRRLRHWVDASVSLDNALNRNYYETQNYFESRATPRAPALFRIHGTPWYPLTVTAGLTFRFGAK